MSLRTRLLLVISLSFFAFFYFASDWLKDELRDHYAFLVEDQMIDIAHLLAAEIEVGPGRIMNLENFKKTVKKYKDSPINSEVFGQKRENTAYDFYLVDFSGTVIFSTRPEDLHKDFSKWNDVYLTLRGKYGSRSTHEDPENSLSSVYYVAAPIRFQNEVVGSLSAIKTEENVIKVMNEAFSNLFWSVVMGFAFIIVLALAITYWFTHPIQALRNYAISVAEGRRVSPPQFSAKDLQELLGSFEYLRSSLDGKEKIEKYTQTLSHEIKSPLTAIKGAAELCEEEMPEQQRKKFLKNIISESDKAHQIIEKMLSISRLESLKFVENKTEIDLSSLCQQVIDCFHGLLSLRNINCRIEGHALIKGDQFLVEQAIRNLVQNAIDFTYNDGEIAIFLNQSEKVAHLEVRDTGAGIPEYALDKVTEKFFSLERPNEKKKSSGLGLSFVAEVALLHGGSIRLVNNKNQPGASARLTFQTESIC